MIKKAKISKNGLYRYRLSRVWNKQNEYVMFIGLNPSIADDIIDDPTLRRCINFANSWGYGGIYMMNLFALRSPSPRDLKTAKDPIGPKTDKYLKKILRKCTLVIPAWGVHGIYLNRDKKVIHILERYKDIKKIACFGYTQEGHPKHPLYIPSNTILQDFIFD